VLSHCQPLCQPLCRTLCRATGPAASEVTEETRFLEQGRVLAVAEVDATRPTDTDVARFREVLGHFATGVTVVTGVEAGSPLGFTCQSLASLSLDPALLVIAPARGSRSWPRIRASGGFCVNVLAQDQESVARRFARSGGSKFAGLAWWLSDRGRPVIEGVLAYIDCDLLEVHDGGDHELVIGSVRELSAEGSRVPDSTGLRAQPRSPLLFYRGSYGRFSEAGAASPR
jgi:3-hydroxy-9,10-secoandrosta-1,3,5(10)-triene-9,17-dione monooxygenase reductase component